MGVNVPRQRAIAFAIGSACAGVAGALFAHFASYVSPESFTILQSIGFLTMIVIGGLGSLAGAVIGSAIVTGVPEALRGIEEYRILAYGLLLVLFMMFLPGGLADLVPRVAAGVRRAFLRGVARGAA
jgi:branched-chain amino acid transport system permease protein